MIRLQRLTLEIAGVAESYGADVEAIQSALPSEPRSLDHSLHPGSAFLDLKNL